MCICIPYVFQLKGKDWSSTMVQARHVATILKLNDALKTPAKK